MRSATTQALVAIIGILLVRLAPEQAREPVFGIFCFVLSLLEWAIGTPWHQHLLLVVLSGAAVALQVEALYYVTLSAYCGFLAATTLASDRKASLAIK